MSFGLNRQTRERGTSGEASARAYLEKKGYGFLCANYRTREGELDLVMRDKDAIVFVEVKSRARRDAGFGFPQEAVTAAKQRRVVLAALQYLKSAGTRGAPIRFDVVSVLPEGLEHIENAFSAPDGHYTL